MFHDINHPAIGVAAIYGNPIEWDRIVGDGDRAAVARVQATSLRRLSWTMGWGNWKGHLPKK